MVIYDKLLGLDLTQYRKAALKTLEFPFKIIAPFLVMIIASLLTQPNSKKALDRLYVKMKTPVDPDPEGDAREIDVSYARPDRFNNRKLLPGSNWEFERPTKMGFLGIRGVFRNLFCDHRRSPMGGPDRDIKKAGQSWPAVKGLLRYSFSLVSIRSSFWFNLR